MPTTPGGIVYPDGASPYPEVNWWQDLAESIDTAIIESEVRAYQVLSPGNQTLSDGAEHDIATPTLSIPASWDTWDVEWAFTFGWQAQSPAAAGTLNVKVYHGGTLLSATHPEAVQATPGAGIITVTGGATGRTGVGAQTVNGTAQLVAADNYRIRERTGRIRAVRTG